MGVLSLELEDPEGGRIPRAERTNQLVVCIRLQRWIGPVTGVIAGNPHDWEKLADSQPCHLCWKIPGFFIPKVHK